MIKVKGIISEGAGTNEDVELPDGATVSDFAKSKKLTQQISNYLVRVNRQKIDDPEKHVLKEGDRVSLTPANIEGARHAGCEAAHGLG